MNWGWYEFAIFFYYFKQCMFYFCFGIVYIDMFLVFWGTIYTHCSLSKEFLKSEFAKLALDHYEYLNARSPTYLFRLQLYYIVLFTGTIVVNVNKFL